jgi:hypothetical protein
MAEDRSLELKLTIRGFSLVVAGVIFVVVCIVIGWTWDVLVNDSLKEDPPHLRQPLEGARTKPTRTKNSRLQRD